MKNWFYFSFQTMMDECHNATNEEPIELKMFEASLYAYNLRNEALTDFTSPQNGSYIVFVHVDPFKRFNLHK